MLNLSQRVHYAITQWFAYQSHEGIVYAHGRRARQVKQKGDGLMSPAITGNPFPE